MANLRVHKRNGNYSEELRQQLVKDIDEIKVKLEELKVKEIELVKDLLELDIKPFKLGGYALVKVPSGKSTKEQKCLLECDAWGVLYARPIKADGELSGRHFSIIPCGGMKYTDILKEVK